MGINTEEWLTRKKGQYFQSWVERAEIIRHLNMVDAVITVPDDDEGSACGAIAKCLEIAETVVFCNGGRVKQSKHREFGLANVYKKNTSLLITNFFGNKKSKQVWMSHADQVSKLPKNFKVVASSTDRKSVV